ncbi:MAG: hypothetical protein FWH26_07530 [Oscillospiraceae bacterium]|nr:hypothetical protein [Oscillospiraceae bacterium]
MLGKLLKHDFMQTGRSIFWLMAGGAAVGGLVTIISSTKDIGAGQFAAAMLLNALLIFVALAIPVLSLVFILVSTNRSLFTEQGYLAFSLPVSSEKLLLSRFLTNVIWILLNYLVSVGLFAVMMTNLRRMFKNAGESLLASMEGAGDLQAQLGDAFYFPSFSAVLQFGGLLLATLLMFLILAMMTAIFVITLSHVRPFQQMAGLWMIVFLVASSVLFFFSVKWISQALPWPFILTIFATGDMLGGQNESVTVNMTTALVMLGLSGGLFAVTDWLFKRKISLK